MSKQLVRFYDSVLVKEAETALDRANKAALRGDAVAQGGARTTHHAGMFAPLPGSAIGPR